MTIVAQGPGSDSDDAPILTLATVMLRRRRFIFVLACVGAIIGLLSGLLSKRTYVSGATFMPQSGDANLSGLAMAASQFGVRLPTGQNGGWGPPVYVELLQSRVLLERVAHDTVTVAEEGGKRVALMDLLEITDPRPEVRVDKTIIALRNLLRTNEAKSLGAVQLSITTRWPSVSWQIANSLLDGVSWFNQATRKSQAGAERRFAEERAADAERSLRAAEDRLQGFLQRNRSIDGSPELKFSHDRLERDVNNRQQIYTALLQSSEEARVREVRDTPVITILESPHLPVIPAPRRSVLKAALGLMGGAFLATVIAFLAHGMRQARQGGNGMTREFFDQLDQVVPRMFRRRAW